MIGAHASRRGPRCYRFYASEHREALSQHSNRRGGGSGVVFAHLVDYFGNEFEGGGPVRDHETLQKGQERRGFTDRGVDSTTPKNEALVVAQISFACWSRRPTTTHFGACGSDDRVMRVHRNEHVREGQIRRGCDGTVQRFNKQQKESQRKNVSALCFWGVSHDGRCLILALTTTTRANRIKRTRERSLPMGSRRSTDARSAR